jgi:uncharacterized protein YjbI with pentapeptide repeats
LSRCQFKKDDWKCSLDAEDNSNFCYWHQKIEGKEPTNEQLDELKKTFTCFVYLQKANLKRAKLKEVFLFGANLIRAEIAQADLREAKLKEAKLLGANLWGANLQKASLYRADLQKANLFSANLQDTFLYGANFQKANLKGADLQKADLYEAKFQKADMRGANFTDSNLSRTHFDANSLLENSILKNVNLYRSFIDSAKSLRDATIFEKEDLEEMEINEQKAEETIYRDKKYARYEVSLEVYNKLYHFYSDEGMNYRAKHAHYRRAEVKRKLLLVKHENLYTRKALPDTLKALFSRIILKNLTGHGEEIERPIGISAFWIIAFGVIFWIVDGIEVTGRSVQPIDYLYLSITTFTGLGFSNIQPDITVPCMQYLVMAESIIGVTMVALIIFVVTYQISR